MQQLIDPLVIHDINSEYKCIENLMFSIIVNSGYGTTGIPIPTVDGINFVDANVLLGTVSIAVAYK